jgi:hypothetical protein
LSSELDLALFPIRHHALKEPEKLWAMMIMSHVTKLMRDDVINGIYRGADQSAVKYRG